MFRNAETRRRFASCGRAVGRFGTSVVEKRPVVMSRGTRRTFAPSTMLARRLSAILVAMVIVVAGLLGTWWARELRFDHEYAKEERLHGIAQAIAVAVERTLATGTLDDLARMATSLQSVHDLVGIVVTDSRGDPLVAPPAGIPPQVDQELELGGGTRDLWLPEREVRARLLPLRQRGGDLIGYLAVVQDWSDVSRQHVRSLQHVVTFTVALAASMALCLWLVVHLMVARPLRRVSEAVDTIGAADRSQPVRFGTVRTDEIGRLAAALDHMQDRLEAARSALVSEHENKRRLERSLQISERLAAVGTLAAGVAHEIGTALNVVQGRTELLLEKEADDRSRAAELQVIIGQCQRISQTVRGLLDFARPEEPRPRPTNLNEVVNEVLGLLAYRLTSFRVTRQLAQDLPLVRVDHAMVEQALLNVVVNALQAMGADGELYITSKTAECAPSGSRGRYAVVSVSDSGPGIPPEHLAHVFEPFFTTKPTGEGSGLGLAITYQLIADQDGEIEAVSQPGSGACFSIYLPVAGASRPVEEDHGV